ncbi:MAG: hypothetical protein HN333_05735 [Rhodospirillaceae bacterium]|nr:hypothetical protein [Rhodospirillaceae bacterium]
MEPARLIAVIGVKQHAVHMAGNSEFGIFLAGCDNRPGVLTIGLYFGDRLAILVDRIAQLLQIPRQTFDLVFESRVFRFQVRNIIRGCRLGEQDRGAQYRRAEQQTRPVDPGGSFVSYFQQAGHFTL